MTWRILTVCLLAGILTLVPVHSASGDYLSRIESRLESDGELRNRISASVSTKDGAVWVFLGENLAGGLLQLPEIGLASPFLDLGPMRESGLLKELGRPAGIGSLRERSGVYLSRALGAAPLHGGVVRIRDYGELQRRVELYALSRAGLAPAGTRSGGISLFLRLNESVDLVGAAKVTAFGRRANAEEWFGPTPQVEIPVLTRFGARMSVNLHRIALILSGGVSLSDRVSSTGFFSGSVFYRMRLGNIDGVSDWLPTTALSVRVDAGLTDPDYFGDDARYVGRVALVHPAVFLRFSGMRFSGSYGYSLYRLPLVPVVDRRQIHAAAGDVTFEFPHFPVGWGLSQSLEFTEEGRTLLKRTATVHSRLRVGGVSLGGKLELIHANDVPDQVKARVGIELSDERSRVELWTQARDSVASGGVDCAIVGGTKSIRIGLRVNRIGTLDMNRASFVPVDSPGDLLSTVVLSVSWETSSK